MNINKKVKMIHKDLDKYLEEVILEDCEKISDKFFETYRPKMDTVSSIIEEIYKVPKMTTDEYDVYFYQYMDIIEEVQGKNRRLEIYSIVNEVFNDSIYSTLDYMIEFLVKELVRIGMDRNRVSIEIEKARYRYKKNVERFHNMKINEIDEEFMSVMMFGQESLLDYGRRCVIGFFEEENDENDEIEVVDYEKSNQYIKITELDKMIDFVESHGFKKVRQCGSHTVYKNDKGNITVIPVHHGNVISKGLGYTIQKQVYQAL